MAPWRALSLLSLVVCLASPARAAITCTQTDGPPGRETTVQITIDSPDDGATIPARTACGSKVTITGSYVVDSPPLQYDFYIVIDASGSTLNDSGADVNGNGILRERADNIYNAEIQAAQDFVRAVDPTASRVAVIRFSSAAVVRQELTTDLVLAYNTLEAMRSETPTGGTNYVPALEAVRLEMVARGDATRLQRCVFLSDGAPSDPLADIEAKATELAAMFLQIDTFALGALDSEALRSMARITRGQFTALAVPGDIIDLLPSFATDVGYSFESREVGSGNTGIMVLDDTARTFQAIVNLVGGPNHVELVLTAYGAPPVTVTCTIDLTVPDPLTPDAGPSIAACAGSSGTLDASASTVECFQPVYRWLDCNGNPLADWSTLPTLDVFPCALPCETVTLELSCLNDACSDRATTIATCSTIPPPVPVVVSTCGLEATLDCGVADPRMGVAWDLDPRADADGDGNPMNDADVAGCGLVTTYPTGGVHDAVAWVTDPASGCTSFQRIGVDVADFPGARNVDGGTCIGMPAAFSCGTADPAFTYWWDFDETADSDSDGDPTNDRDAVGCDVDHSFLTGGRPEVHGWTSDAAGCTWLIAQGVIDVSNVALPGEAADLRVSRSGDSVTITWAAVPGVVGHRVLRGLVVPLNATGAYDHAADDAASQGACLVASPTTTFTDLDDARDAEAYYYLVTGVNDCGGEGPAGQGWDRRQLFDRPARLSTGGCP